MSRRPRPSQATQGLQATRSRGELDPREEHQVARDLVVGDQPMGLCGLAQGKRAVVEMLPPRRCSAAPR